MLRKTSKSDFTMAYQLEMLERDFIGKIWISYIFSVIYSRAV